MSFRSSSQPLIPAGAAPWCFDHNHGLVHSVDPVDCLLRIPILEKCDVRDLHGWCSGRVKLLNTLGLEVALAHEQIFQRKIYEMPPCARTRDSVECESEMSFDPFVEEPREMQEESEDFGHKSPTEINQNQSSNLRIKTGSRMLLKTRPVTTQSVGSQSDCGSAEPCSEVAKVTRLATLVAPQKSVESLVTRICGAYVRRGKQSQWPVAKLNHFLSPRVLARAYSSIQQIPIPTKGPDPASAVMVIEQDSLLSGTQSALQGPVRLLLPFRSCHDIVVEAVGGLLTTQIPCSGWLGIAKLSEHDEMEISDFVVGPLPFQQFQTGELWTLQAPVTIMRDTRAALVMFADVGESLSVTDGWKINPLASETIDFQFVR
eukprot:c19673_g1_i2.p1 GENE.c19673_g1_i2~~c19673_g1_i2.p1  ORF type:complete len:374 (+),score=46.95 c19673_g1_i2:441-1562(+)